MLELREGWSRLDATIDEMGSDGLMSHILWKLSEGSHPSEIANEFGLPWVVLKKWIESDGTRVKDFELARRALGDKLAWDGIAEAKNSDIETVALGKYRTDTYMKIAGKLNRGEWGDQEVKGSGGITVVVQRGLTAEVTTGGVLTIGPSENKGYPVPMEREING